MSQTTEVRIAGIVSLLPLLESHLDHHGCITSRAQWVSPPEPRPPGYMMEPEPTCDGRCTVCLDFGARRCTLREERWMREWNRHRHRYPVLRTIERLLLTLGQKHPTWADAVYWMHQQPWGMWNPETIAVWAELGVGWIEAKIPADEWIPTHAEEVRMKPRTDGGKDADIMRLRIEGWSHHAIAKEVGCSKSTVAAVLKGGRVLHGRILSADGS